MAKAKEKEKSITNRPQDTSKRLTLSEKLMIKADEGLSSLVVASKYGVSDSTVRRIWKDERLSQHDSKVAIIKKTIAGTLYNIAEEGIQQASKVIEFSSARDAMIVAATAIDKARLIDGESTQNVGIAGLMQVIHTNELSPSNLKFNSEKTVKSTT